MSPKSQPSKNKTLKARSSSKDKKRQVLSASGENYAIIAISGSQFQVSPGQTITVDNLNLEPDKTSSTDQVLLLVDGKKVKVGQPTIKNASVEFKILKNYKGKKIRVFKYKAKSRYRRTQGFRPQLTDIQITDIKIKK